MHFEYFRLSDDCLKLPYWMDSIWNFTAPNSSNLHETVYEKKKMPWSLDLKSQEIQRNGFEPWLHKSLNALIRILFYCMSRSWCEYWTCKHHRQTGSGQCRVARRTLFRNNICILNTLHAVSFLFFSRKKKKQKTLRFCVHYMLTESVEIYGWRCKMERVKLKQMRNGCVKRKKISRRRTINDDIHTMDEGIIFIFIMSAQIT